MFWVSLRQMVQEKLISNMSLNQEQTEPHALASKYGKVCLQFLVKVWMWIVVITLFAYGIIGTKMDAFRIIYMILFLVYVVVFQVLFLAFEGKYIVLINRLYFSFP